MNVYLCVHDNIENNKTFNDTLKDLFIKYPDLDFIDFRDQKMNWYYYDFRDFGHPPGIRGNPNLIRHGIFNHKIDSPTLTDVSINMWDELYYYLKLYDRNVPEDLFEVKDYLRDRIVWAGGVEMEDYREHMSLEKYIDLAIFFNVVGSNGHAIEWCFHK